MHADVVAFSNRTIYVMEAKKSIKKMYHPISFLRSNIFDTVNHNCTQRNQSTTPLNELTLNYIHRNYFSYACQFLSRGTTTQLITHHADV